MFWVVLTAAISMACASKLLTEQLGIYRTILEDLGYGNSNLTVDGFKEMLWLLGKI